MIYGPEQLKRLQRQRENSRKWHEENRLPEGYVVYTFILKGKSEVELHTLPAAGKKCRAINFYEGRQCQVFASPFTPGFYVIAELGAENER